jgi:hypothetical protein
MQITLAEKSAVVFGGSEFEPSGFLTMTAFAEYGEIHSLSAFPREFQICEHVVPSSDSLAARLASRLPLPSRRLMILTARTLKVSEQIVGNDPLISIPISP